MATYTNEEYSVEIKTDENSYITKIVCTDGEMNIKIGQSIKYKDKKLRIVNKFNYVKLNDEELHFTCSVNTATTSTPATKDRGGFEEDWQMNVFMSS